MSPSSSSSHPAQHPHPSQHSHQVQALDEFVTKLKRSHFQSDLHLAVATLELVRLLLSKRKLHHVRDMIESLHGMGVACARAKRTEFVSCNIIRRVMKIVRDLQKELKEETLCQKTPTANPTPRLSLSHDAIQRDHHLPDTVGTGGGASPPSFALKKSLSSATLESSLSLHKLLDQSSGADEMSGNSSNAPSDKHKRERSRAMDEERVWMNSKLKPAVLEELHVLMNELKDCEGEIAKQSVQHVFTREVIMTYGYSETVTAFLKYVAKTRHFQVFVCESLPSLEGRKQAQILSQHNIDTTLISDSASFALMPNVSKVIVSCHAVMANGGLIATAGGLALSAAARHHSKPFVVLAGLHKLTPLYPFDASTFNEYRSPAALLPFDQAMSENITVENLAYDYITPDLVTLLLTNNGGHSPSYIYRLLTEHYYPQDTEFRENGTTDEVCERQPSALHEGSSRLERSR